MRIFETLLSKTLDQYQSTPQTTQAVKSFEYFSPTRGKTELVTLACRCAIIFLTSCSIATRCGARAEERNLSIELVMRDKVNRDDVRKVARTAMRKSPAEARLVLCCHSGWTIEERYSAIVRAIDDRYRRVYQLQQGMNHAPQGNLDSWRSSVARLHREIDVLTRDKMDLVTFVRLDSAERFSSNDRYAKLAE